MKNRCQNLMPWEPPEMGSMDTTQCGWCCCCCCGSIKILILHCLAMVARDIGNGGPRYWQWRGGTGVCYFWDPMLKITWKNTWELFGLGPNTIIKRRPPSIFLFQRGKNVVWKIINIYKQRRTRWFFNFWPQRFQLLFWAQKECVREHDARGRDCVDCPL